MRREVLGFFSNLGKAISLASSIPEYLNKRTSKKQRKTIESFFGFDGPIIYLGPVLRPTTPNKSAIIAWENPSCVGCAMSPYCEVCPYCEEVFSCGRNPCSDCEQEKINNERRLEQQLKQIF